MATVQKFAALPFDKYLTLLEKIKERTDGKDVRHSNPPAVNYQHGGREISADEKRYQSQKSIDADSKQTATPPPPPGLPASAAEDFASTSDNETGDNWVDVWQPLK